MSSNKVSTGSTTTTSASSVSSSSQVTMSTSSSVSTKEVSLLFESLIASEKNPQNQGGVNQPTPLSSRASSPSSSSSIDLEFADGNDEPNNNSPSPQPTTNNFCDVLSSLNNSSSNNNSTNNNISSCSSVSNINTNNNNRINISSTSSTTSSISGPNNNHNNNNQSIEQTTKKKSSSSKKNKSQHISVKAEDSRVFAKVCVAQLRQSFGDLTNLGTVSSRSPSTMRSKSLTETELQSACGLVSVASLKSSFSKFDQIQKQSSGTDKDSSQQQIKNNHICKSCNSEVFLVELIKAEKANWHKHCFKCTECHKILNVDTYSSHEGRIYCKPHFKTLFQPKAVVASEEDESAIRAKHSVIIRESQPVELPPDVVRASDKSSEDLEDMQIDVRSKYELFERGLKDSNKEEANFDHKVIVKRSPSVLARLARYENGSQAQGVLNDDLNGQLSGDESPEEDQDNEMIRKEVQRKLKTPLSAMSEVLQLKQLEEVRAKWEEGGVGGNKDAQEQRKAEMNKFRTRLCMGKSNHLKDLYESGQFVQEVESKTNNVSSELEELKVARNFRDKFERGEVFQKDDDEKPTENKIDLDVFENGVGKQSRNIFKEIDQQIEQSKSSPNVRVLEKPPPRVIKQLELRSSNDDVKSGDSPTSEGLITRDELKNKFKFFETYNENEGKKQKKVFNIKDELDLNAQNGSNELETSEPYRDPTIVRSDDQTPDETLHKSKTASKMLSVFKQMEQDQQKGYNGPKPLKEFTPPREPIRMVESSGSEAEESGDEGSEVDEGENPNPEPVDSEKDAFLKEVGSLARARSLRARFERWENTENSKNADKVIEDLSESIEPAKNLKMKFEMMKEEMEQKNKKEVKSVRRFV